MGRETERKLRTSSLIKSDQFLHKLGVPDSLLLVEGLVSGPVGESLEQLLREARGAQVKGLIGELNITGQVLPEADPGLGYQ